MHTILTTTDLVKYDIHLLKPTFQKLVGTYDSRAAGT